jgi:hypothetical protein
MGTQAIIELYLRSAGWIKRTGGSELWSHEQIEGYKTTEEAQEITQRWEDLAFDDDGPEPEEDDCED